MTSRFTLSISRRRFVAQLAAASISVGKLGTSGTGIDDGSQGRPSLPLLIKEGRPKGRIYLGDGADAEEIRAASDLSYHLQAMSGAQLEIVRIADPAQVAGPAIVLGRLARGLGAEPVPATPSREGFRIRTRGGLVLVSGESGSGTAFGVYRLLEALGCEWVMPGPIGEIVPTRRDVPVPDLDIVDAPAFRFRNLWYGGGRRIVSRADRDRLDEWLRRQRCGDQMTPARETAGHYWGRFIRKHRGAFEADPTLYALRPDRAGDLVRGGPQIETTHPRVIELMAEDIRSEFRRRAWPKDRTVGFPIGPSDGLGFSRSPESVAANSGRTDPVSGEPDVTDLVVLLGNRVIERLGPEYPNVHVGYYSYSVHGSFPARYTPHPRLVPTFAPIGYSRFHSLLDRTSVTQRARKAALDQWGALARRQGNKMVFRGYNWNLADNMLPYCKARIWGEELPYHADLGVEGLNIEGTKAWSVNALGDWIYAKLAWNPRQDWRALVTRYCRKSFGAGADRMEAYYRRLIDRQHGAGQEAGSYFSFPLIYDQAFVSAAEADLAAAAAAAEGEDEKTRIDFVGIGVRALRLYLDYFHATQRFDFGAALAHYRALHEHWRRAHALNPDLVAKEAPRHLERFIGPFVEQAAAFASGDRRLLLPLPDALTTVMDPCRRGAERGFSRGLPQVDARMTRTYMTTWSDQELRPVASVWYQHRFRLPSDHGGGPLGLFLGGFDDSARVWLNGAPVGSTGRIFSRPAWFDLSDAIGRAGDNLLVIEISREDSINEIGIGGLIRPSFLFAGPIPAAPA